MKNNKKNGLVSALVMSLLLGASVSSTAMAQMSQKDEGYNAPTPSYFFLSPTDQKLFWGYDNGDPDSFQYTLYSWSAYYQEPVDFPVPRKACVLGAYNGLIAIDPTTSKLMIIDANKTSDGVMEVDLNDVLKGNCQISPKPH